MMEFLYLGTMLLALFNAGSAQITNDQIVSTSKIVDKVSDGGTTTRPPTYRPPTDAGPGYSGGVIGSPYPGLGNNQQSADETKSTNAGENSKVAYPDSNLVVPESNRTTTTRSPTYQPSIHNGPGYTGGQIGSPYPAVGGNQQQQKPEGGNSQADGVPQDRGNNHHHPCTCHHGGNRKQQGVSLDEKAEQNDGSDEYLSKNYPERNSGAETEQIKKFAAKIIKTGLQSAGLA